MSLAGPDFRISGQKSLQKAARFGVRGVTRRLTWRKPLAGWSVAAIALACSGAGRSASAGCSIPTTARAPARALEDRIPEIKRARQGARERLGDARCQGVPADFRSVDGRRLDEVLQADGRSAQEQLDLLVLLSGLGRPGCGRATLAFTHVRSPVVSICLRPFTLLRPQEQEAVLIHEMLHSLGLGENPPESVAITSQVLKRCRDAGLATEGIEPDGGSPHEPTAGPGPRQ